MSRTADEFEPKSGEILRFGGAVYRLDTKKLQCTDGQPLDLRDQSAEVLAHLARHAGQVVTKAELASAVWGDTFVTDDSLVQCIGDIRRVLGDADHRIIETLVKRGYRLNQTGFGSDALVVEEIPRVAVLAFEDHSTGKNRGFLSDAIAGGLITELAHFGEFSVVSRASSFKFRSNGLGTGAIGAELGAQFVVEGSQQVADGKLRVSVQLIEVQTETNLWAHVYDYDQIEDFEVQSDVIKQVAASIGFRIRAHAPSLVAPTNRGAMYYFLASGADVQMPSMDSLRFATEMNLNAIKADPMSPYGYIGLSFVNLAKYLERWESSDTVGCVRRAAEYGDKALGLSPRNSQAHFARGEAHLAADELDHAERRFRRSIALNPHAPHVQASLACLMMFLGENDKAIAQIEQAMWANPDHPDWFFALHAATLRQDQQYEAALSAFQNMATVPGSNHMQLGAILAGLDRQAEAEAAMKLFLDKVPHHTVRREREAVEGKFAKSNDLNRWLGLIRQAGLPE